MELEFEITPEINRLIEKAMELSGKTDLCDLLNEGLRYIIGRKTKQQEVLKSNPPCATQ